MEKIAEIKNESAADQRGTTAPSQSGEHVISGGPRAVAGNEQIVMGDKLRPLRKAATPEQNLARRVSAWRVDVAMSVLGWSRSRMANLLGCSPGTVSNYASGETDVTLAAWSLIEAELRRLGLFAEFEVRRLEREHALTKRRIA
jgi:transcriptional regulator with XRE-family HTH domain